MAVAENVVSVPPWVEKTKLPGVDAIVSPPNEPPNEPVPLKVRTLESLRSTEVMLVSEKVTPSRRLNSGEAEPPTATFKMSLIVPHEPPQISPANVPVP